VAQLQKDLNNAQADVAGFAIRLQAAIATRTTDLQLEADKQVTLKANKVGFDAATAVFNGLEHRDFRFERSDRSRGSRN
jgi:hypothetical protein